MCLIWKMKLPSSKFHAIKPLVEHSHSISKCCWCFPLNVSKFQPPVASPLCSRLASVLPQTLFHIAACLSFLCPAEPGCFPLSPSLTHSPLPCVKTTRYTFFKKFLAHLTFFVLLFYDPLYYTLSRECTLTCPVLFLLLILTFLTKKCVFLKAHSLLTTLLL